MSDDTGNGLGAILRTTLTVIGVGFVLCLAVGVVVGLVIDDVPRGVGRTVAIGMSATAVACVAILLIPRRK